MQHPIYNIQTERSCCVCMVAIVATYELRKLLN